MKEQNLRQLQAQQTRLTITKVAMDLLKTKPYDNIKISDICKKAHVSIGTFYHYFETKEHIIIDAYDIIDKLIMDEYQRKQFDSAIDSILWLNRSIAFIISSFGANYVANCYRQLLVDKTKYTLSPDRAVHKELHKLLEKAMKDHELIETDLVHISEYINKTARGNIFDWCIKNGEFDLLQTLTEEVKNILTLYRA